MKLLIKKGSTSVIQCIYIISTSDTALTGLTYNSAGLSAYYFRSGDTSATSITLTDTSLGTFTSGGFKEVDSVNMPGLYEIHFPNAVFATGSDNSYLILKGATNMYPVTIEIQLVDAKVFLPFVRVN